MSDEEHIEGMRDILNNGDVPQHVTNKMILSAIQAMWRRMGHQNKTLAEIKQVAAALDLRVSKLEDDRAENPPVFAYFKERPIRATGIIIGFMVMLTIALSFSEPLRAWVSSLIP